MSIKNTTISLIATVAFCAATLGAVAAERSIGLIGLGDVTPEELQAVQAHMEIYLPVPVEILEPRAPLGAESLEAEAAALVELVEGRYGVVGIVSAAPEVESFGLFLPAERTAVINETALGQEPDKRLPRFKKEGMRCAGLLLGLRPGPDTRCCMYHYMDLAGLDHKGGNFSPPLLVQLMNMYPDWRPSFIIGADEWVEEVDEAAEAVEEAAAAAPAEVPAPDAAPEVEAPLEQAAPLAL